MLAFARACRFNYVTVGDWFSTARRQLSLSCVATVALLPANLQDDDPYVKKTAAICVAKLYDISPELVEDRGFIDMLQVRSGNLQRPPSVPVPQVNAGTLVSGNAYRNDIACARQCRLNVSP